MARTHNFSAGPALLPLSVVETIASTLPEFKGTGLGLMEISHRSKEFEATVHSAQQRLRDLAGIPDDYTILFQQGGASLQFYMTPLNLLNAGDKADFLLTGTWSNKAIKEARRIGDAAGIWDGKENGYSRVPRDDEYTVREGATYVHYTSNNTIYGTQYTKAPSGDAHLVCDMSSDICSRPIDVPRHDVIFAGAQKNLGPSGVCVVILSPWAMAQSGKRELPSMLDWTLQKKKDSMFNTPNTLGIFALDCVLEWVGKQGGLSAMETRNTAKAQAIYAEIDRTDFWRSVAHESSRSKMNVTWRTPSEDLDKTFVAEANAAGLMGLKGHRSVGGLRASIYNACEQGSVDVLVDFMRDFEKRHG